MSSINQPTVYVRPETNDERLSRIYGNGIIHVGDYDGMHEGPPTNFVKNPSNYPLR